MQVTCLRENLSRGLANVSRAVASRATLPVTQNVLLEGDNGQLKLTATNTEISISTWIGAQIEGEGSLTIPARMLTDFVNSLPGQTVQLDFQTDPVGIEITCDKFNATIHGIASEEFPPIPKVDGGATVKIPADTFRGALERVVFAAPVLTARIEIARAEDFAPMRTLAQRLTQEDPTLVLGRDEDSGSLLETSLSAGVGYQPVPMRGVIGAGLNWGKPNGLDRDQYTGELFWRYQLTKELAVTPSIQYIRNPALNPTEDSLFAAGLRFRVVL